MATPKADVPAIQAANEAAFAAANGRPCPPLAYERGWFVFREQGRVDGRYRASDLVAMTARLREQASACP